MVHLCRHYWMNIVCVVALLNLRCAHHVCNKYFHSAIFEMLYLQRGIKGGTALTMACQNGNKEIVDILLEYNADVNLQWEVIISCLSQCHSIVLVIIKKVESLYLWVSSISFDCIQLTTKHVLSMNV